jgi:hypothetical protein
MINKNIINNNRNLIEKRSELFSDNKFVPVKITNLVLKCVCKINIKRNGGNIFGTGFFMKMNNYSKYLVTNYHVISENSINEYIEIEIHNGKRMNLNLNNRDIKYFPKPKDITIIELKNYDDIYNDIELLDYDTNYITKGYKIYKGSYIFTIEYPYGEDPSSASGKILNIMDDYEFEHNIPTDSGSSGCPIILLNNNINLCQVIGIHKEADLRKNVNCGTFIGEIFNVNVINNNNNLNNDNYIIAEIDINKDYQINQDTRILNSYEEFKRYYNHKEINEDEKNEE